MSLMTVFLCFLKLLKLFLTGVNETYNIIFVSMKEFFVSGTFGALGTRFGAFGTLKKKKEDQPTDRP
jgi:hypothetical protein